MRRPLLVLGGLLLAAVLGTPADAQRRGARPAAAAVNWARQAVRTAEGGYLLGNPAARVKLVEYGSIGCPHCAAFANEGMAALKQDYIRTGRVSYEYRPIVLFDTDPGIYTRLLCQAPLAALGTVERLYATQAEWRGRVRAHQAELEAMTPEQRQQAAFGLAGIETLVPSTRAGGRACTPPAQDVQRLGALQEEARRTGINGVPSFAINGVLHPDVRLWNDPAHPPQSLEPLLRQALAQR